MKRWEVLALACAAFLAVSGANAGVITDYLGDVSKGNSYFYDFPNYRPPSGFSDDLSFTMKTNGDVSDSILSFFHAGGLSIELFDDTTHSDLFDCAGKKSCTKSQNFGDLIKGDEYTLTFAGNTKGGMSTINGFLNVSAVPEPTSLAMVLLGGGFMVVLLRGRRRTLTTSSASMA